MGFLDRVFGRRRRKLEELVARANAAGIDGAAVREILQTSRGPGGKIDWQAAAAKARERGLDVEKLKSLMR